MKMEVDSMENEKVTQTGTNQEQQQKQTQQQDQQQQEQTQQQEQQQTVDMKTYLELVAKMEKMEQMLANEAEKAQKMAEKEQELFQKQVQLIEEFILDDTNKENVGVYFYDYVLPDDKQEIIFEFRGLYNEKPILSRGKVKIEFSK